MPQEALPIDPGTGSSTLIPFRRVYRDLLQRPMRTGTVTITGTGLTRMGELTVSPAAVKAKLVEGVLDVALPPDTYELVADLWSVDDVQSTDQDTIVLSP